jgi:hypothetical protein
VWCVSALLASLSNALAFPPPGDVAPASFSEQAARSIEFGRSPAKVGQRIEQTVTVDLALKTRSRQGAKVLEEASTRMRRDRQRRLVTAEVTKGGASAVYVTYLQSQQARNEGPIEKDPIAGKTYFCRREGERLVVLTRRGEVPPAEEFQLVSENMETLGRENPLAAYLAGKRLAVGQRVALPPEVAKQLLGLDHQLGEVTRFELTLSAIEQRQGRPCGVFQADIEAQRTDASQMRLLIAGPMVIEARTCRAVSSDLSGPIGMSHSAPDPRGRVQIDSTGRLSLTVATRQVEPGAM